MGKELYPMIKIEPRTDGIEGMPRNPGLVDAKLSRAAQYARQRTNNLCLIKDENHPSNRDNYDSRNKSDLIRIEPKEGRLEGMPEDPAEVDRILSQAVQRAQRRFQSPCLIPGQYDGGHQ